MDLAQADLDAADAASALTEEERGSRAADLDGYRRESGYIRAGISLLQESQAAARSLAKGGVGTEERARLERRAAPWNAWLHTNETFARYGGARYTDWRLFQLAFILAHVPTLASRMPEFADRFDAFRDELSASLLYFPTGGGKSEAFFGLLIFNLFLDRLRGKHRGVTALVRYPLRLLTLQQARRLMRIWRRRSSSACVIGSPGGRSRSDSGSGQATRPTGSRRASAACRRSQRRRTPRTRPC